MDDSVISSIDRLIAASRDMVRAEREALSGGTPPYGRLNRLIAVENALKELEGWHTENGPRTSTTSRATTSQSGPATKAGKPSAGTASKRRTVRSVGQVGKKLKESN